MQVNSPAADIDQLTRLDVGQQPHVLRYDRHRGGLGKDDVTDGKQQGGCQSGQHSAKCEGGHGCPLPSLVQHSSSSNERDFRQPEISSCQLASADDGFTALNSVAAMSQSGRLRSDATPETGRSAGSGANG